MRPLRPRLLLACLVLAIGATRGLRRPLASVDELHRRQPAASIAAPALADLYPAHRLEVPVDHFHNDSRYEPHSDATFGLRYWFDSRHYRPGGPVVVLQGGETSGEDRLPFLQKGIAAQLAHATGGLAVVLEHRYYGDSFPVADLATESLRFLSTEQALADAAFFARNARFPGLEAAGGTDLRAGRNTTAWLTYGGSYAGAFSAFLRKLYPDVFWAAVSSSGVTAAIVDYWEYLEAARLYSPPGCAAATQKLTHVVDNILSGGDGGHLRELLLAAFGLEGLSHDADFASVLARGILGLQDTNWDPEVGSTEFGYYCSNITASGVLYLDAATARLNETVRELLIAGGYGGKDESDTLAVAMLNYIGYTNVTQVAPCAESRRSPDECFTHYNESFYRQTDLPQSQWRAWSYQVCTQWGYFLTGSGVPSTQLPLISRLIDLEYASLECRLAFNMTAPPDVDSINRLGGFAFSYPRLAIVDGEADPWRAATPHRVGLPERQRSAAADPFLLIAGGAVHHWDENGRFNNESSPQLPPHPVRHAQDVEVLAAKAWMEEWGVARQGDGAISGAVNDEL